MAVLGPEIPRSHGPAAHVVSLNSCLASLRDRVLLLLPLLLVVSAWVSPRLAHSQAMRGRTRSPHGQMAIGCENCHTSTSWKPIRPAPDFNHTETRFPLRGLHVAVDCRRCHEKLVFSDVGTNCAGCHADLHRGQFGGKCDTCHTVRGWRVSLEAVRRHENRFPLMGAHAAVECDSCHKGAANGVFVGLSTDCVGEAATQVRRMPQLRYVARGQV
jgi:hypothetical protein